MSDNDGYSQICKRRQDMLAAAIANPHAHPAWLRYCQRLVANSTPKKKLHTEESKSTVPELHRVMDDDLALVHAIETACKESEKLIAMIKDLQCFTLVPGGVRYLTGKEIDAPHIRAQWCGVLEQVNIEGRGYRLSDEYERHLYGSADPEE